MKMDPPFDGMRSGESGGFIHHRFARQRVIQVQINSFVTIGLADDHLVQVNTIVERSQCLARFPSRHQLER